MTNNTEENIWLTTDEGLALLIGLDILPEKLDAFDILNAFLEDAEVALENADINISKAQKQRLTGKVEIAKYRLQQANSIENYLRIEIENIQNNNLESILEINNKNPQIRISKNSLRNWSKHNFGICFLEETNNVPTYIERKHSSKLLDILDETIVTFWENVDADRPPTNELIKQHWKNKYPGYLQIGKYHLLSDKVQESMLKIMKPDK